MNKIYSLLGLCQRAGRLVSGELACEKAIQQKNACMILVAQDASANCKKKFVDSGKYYHVPVQEFGTKESLGEAIGKELRAVLVVTDQGFARKLCTLLEMG